MEGWQDHSTLLLGEKGVLSEWNKMSSFDTWSQTEEDLGKSVYSKSYVLFWTFSVFWVIFGKEKNTI